MPSGRDSFRRNRVAPICYDSLQPYYITRSKSHVAAGVLSPHAQRFGHAALMQSGTSSFLANAARNHQRLAGNPGRFSGSQKNRSR